ncbi:MAG: response regulator [gamma proteobacterium symbiont of Bathyaustriella thionipta]|nr:response regulator [gamma proteobacterium symbiont of Bathyaustriella thionipta]MCU7949888.1 response regulator [gamma proteobacterium symbiont of Bathyaustriella thionipta]MCU7953909.1 response regulator [gamma proteobacterium symbiont of Bathyaustriella thionipta]MCU7956485.1 response regulator [gamma proteobacterium symbiont of Bathyaustriella thionipta]MCU7965707.1 response regulator [gamma proteobacterium symbiont of Bathyaustriella thionipta]
MDGSKAAILIVDDEPFNLDIIKEYLDDENYILFTAKNGEDAWKQLKENPDKFDVVLLDRMMPKLDGMQVLKRIKAHQRLKSIPVILQTAKSSQQDIIDGMNSGAYYYLTKPFNDEMLCSIVSTAVEDKMRYNILTMELEESVRGLATLQNAYFEYQTLDEANDLAKVLANACAQPDKVVIGISELLINAVEHGNLKICYDDKSRLIAKGKWIDEVNSRLKLTRNKNKKVRVSFKRESHINRILIEDEGTGFEWQNFLELDPKRAFDSHGRGIAMARISSLDEINFQGGGNKVEIIVQAGGTEQK